MCIIIYKPEDKKISKETLEQCWKSNPDGAGYMYNHNNRLRIKKGFMSFDRFYASFSNLQHKNAVIHFRIKTHGKADELNTHPFFISKELGFVHNGVITEISTATNKEMSDTWHFNEQILKGLYTVTPNFIESTSIQVLIKKYIGLSKLVFLDNKDNVQIINEENGDWVDGLWYSNTSYKIPKPARKNFLSSEYPVQYRTKEKPILSYSNVKNLTINTLVRSRENYLSTKKNTMGIVETFYQDHTCGVLFFPSGQSEGIYTRIPIYMLDIDEDDFIVNQNAY